MVQKPIEYNMPEESFPLRMAAEDPIEYVTQARAFSINQFNTLNAILGFSQQEWAQILHISLRTLQRYLKDSSEFEGLHAELLHHLQRLTDLGLKLFETKAGFVQWIRVDKSIMDYTIGFDALKSITGIRLLRQELGRMAEGVYV